MLSDLARHKTAYSLLALAAAVYVYGAWTYRTNPTLIVGGTAIFAALYIGWGIAHHLVEHSLTFRVVLEYVLVAALAVTVVSTLLI